MSAFLDHSLAHKNTRTPRVRFVLGLTLQYANDSQTKHVISTMHHCAEVFPYSIYCTCMLK